MFRNNQNLHSIHDEGATVVSDEEDTNEEIEIVFTKDEDEDLPSLIEPQEEDHLDDHSNITEEDVSELANLLQPSDPKTQGICYDMLYKGKCEKVSCPYSHKPDDIDKAKKLKALRTGPNGKTSPRQVSFQKSGNSINLRKT